MAVTLKVYEPPVIIVAPAGWDEMVGGVEEAWELRAWGRTRSRTTASLYGSSY